LDIKFKYVLDDNLKVYSPVITFGESALPTASLQSIVSASEDWKTNAQKYTQCRVTGISVEFRSGIGTENLGMFPPLCFVFCPYSFPGQKIPFGNSYFRNNVNTLRVTLPNTNADRTYRRYWRFMKHLTSSGSDFFGAGCLGSWFPCISNQYKGNNSWDNVVSILPGVLGMDFMSEIRSNDDPLEGDQLTVGTIRIKVFSQYMGAYK